MATRLRYNLTETIEFQDILDPLRQRLNDLTTDQRIHSATAKLQALAAGLPLEFPRQDERRHFNVRADSSSSQDTLHTAHGIDTPDEHLTAQQLYFRNYWQSLSVESPRSLSPTPPPSTAPWRPPSHTIEADKHSPRFRSRHHKITKGRVSKTKTNHSMVTRSRVRPGQRFLALDFSGRPP